MQTDFGTFRTAVAETVNELGLKETNWKAEGWKNLWSKVNQDVLDDAFSNNSVIYTTFSNLGRIEARSSSKNFTRVQEKMTEQTTGRENYFKVVSDYIAARVPCDVAEICEKIDCLREIVFNHGGIMHVRGATDENTYGLCKSPDKKYSDIVQFVYVWSKEIGVPIEFQIGHEFSAHTFEIDSELRDPTCKKIDLWGNDFYPNVKNYLLDKANGRQPVFSKEELVKQADVLHNGNVPEELKSILDKI